MQHNKVFAVYRQQPNMYKREDNYLLSVNQQANAQAFQKPLKEGKDQQSDSEEIHRHTRAAIAIKDASPCSEASCSSYQLHCHLSCR